MAKIITVTANCIVCGTEFTTTRLPHKKAKQTCSGKCAGKLSIINAKPSNITSTGLDPVLSFLFITKKI